jgi:hypothetical protein
LDALLDGCLFQATPYLFLQQSTHLIGLTGIKNVSLHLLLDIATRTGKNAAELQQQLPESRRSAESDGRVSSIKDSLVTMLTGSPASSCCTS